MSRRPGPIPPNATPLVVLAAIIAPIVVRNAKPIVRAMGRATERAGNFLQRLAEDCPCKDKAEAAPAAEAEAPVEVVEEPAVDAPAEPAAAEAPKKPAPKRPKKKPAPKRPADQA